MRSALLPAACAAIMAIAGVSARFLPDVPPVTRTSELLNKRQQTPTSTMQPPTSTLKEDPWQCVTENITQYFDVPQPTGDVLSGINSYGNEVAQPCLATATGLDRFYCTVSDPKSWCGFTTAAPENVLSSYSTYVSAVVSFWTAKSSTISILSTSCPVAWDRPDLAQHEWLKIAMAHANCYLEAHHPQTKSTAAATAATTSGALSVPTSTTSAVSEPTPASESTPINESSSRSNQALETIALVSTGLAVLANAV